MGSSTRPSRGFRVGMGPRHVLGGLAMCLAMLHAAVDRAVPEPYMDEVFHVGQAAQYCLGHWGHWDPKISTFPGLYVVPALVARASVAALGLDASEVCFSVRLYRASNAAALLLCAWITYGLLRRLHPAMTRGEAAWKTLALAVLPTHFFYASLFYTDVASLACVLGCYALSLDGKAAGSAVAGAVAVLYRQTNVVWVAFIAGAAILERLGGDKAVVQASPGGRALLSALRRQVLLHPGLRVALLRALPHAVVVLGALCFFVHNGGLAVGDKDAHVSSFHPPQVLYFLLFVLGASFPRFARPSQWRAQAMTLKHDAQAIFGPRFKYGPAAAALGALFVVPLTVTVVSRFTRAHPYTLADNRHYTFYVWRRIIDGAWWTRYALIPLELYAAWSLWASLRARQSILWTLGYAACVIAVLTPALMLEFRYYTVPFVLASLHWREPSLAPVKAAALVGVAVNLVTLYVFLYRPFTWPAGTVERFMW